MIKASKISRFLDSNFKYKNKEEWDRVGHLFGHKDKPIEKVVIALDLTTTVFEQAIKNKAQLIITHHPFIFNEDVKIDFEIAPYKQDLLLRIENTGMNIITLHTNYDSSHQGTGFQIAKAIGLEKFYSHVTKYGGIIKHPIKIGTLEEIFKNKMNLNIYQTNIFNNNLFDNFGVIPGAGSPEEIIALSKKGAQLIITSDIKWSTWITAKEHDIKLVEISHSIEDVFTRHITNLIKNKFTDINVIPCHTISY